MSNSNIQWEISENIGKVSGILQKSADCDGLMILGHGAGAGMQHPFMESLASKLFQHNIAVCRYNFPYMEKGKRRPDFPAVTHVTIRKILEGIKSDHDLPIILGGKSFGGRMSSQLLSKEPGLEVHGAVFYGFPLHGIGKDGVERGDHLLTIEKPLLFLQGTRDKLAKKALIQSVTKNMANAKLVFFEEADHSFKVPKRTGFTHEEIIDQLAQETRNWFDTHILK